MHVTLHFLLKNWFCVFELNSMKKGIWQENAVWFLLFYHILFIFIALFTNWFKPILCKNKYWNKHNASSYMYHQCGSKETTGFSSWIEIKLNVCKRRIVRTKIFPIPTIIIYFIKKILPHSPAVYSRDLLQAWQCLHRSSTHLQCLPFGMQDMNSKQNTILSYISVNMSVEDYE